MCVPLDGLDGLDTLDVLDRLDGLNLSWLGPGQAGRDRRLGRLFQGYKVPLKGFLEVSHEIAALCAFLVWSGTNVIGP